MATGVSYGRSGMFLLLTKVEIMCVVESSSLDTWHACIIVLFLLLLLLLLV